jgi:hypothetical protein
MKNQNNKPVGCWCNHIHVFSPPIYNRLTPCPSVSVCLCTCGIDVETSGGQQLQLLPIWGASFSNIVNVARSTRRTLWTPTVGVEVEFCFLSQFSKSPRKTKKFDFPFLFKEKKKNEDSRRARWAMDERVHSCAFHEMRRSLRCWTGRARLIAHGRMRPLITHTHK